LKRLLPAVHPGPQVRQLLGLLPHMASLRSLKPAELVRMAAAVEQITARLVALRRRFPGADVAAMVAAHPPLLRMDEAEVEAAVAAVRHAFPEASQVGAAHMCVWWAEGDEGRMCGLGGGVPLQCFCCR
jgi:hypothetical protein